MQNTSLSSLRLREFIRDTTWCFDFLPVPQVDTIHLPYFLAFTEVLCCFLNPENMITFQRPWTLTTNFLASRYFISLIDVSPVLKPAFDMLASETSQACFIGSRNQWTWTLWNTTQACRSANLSQIAFLSVFINHHELGWFVLWMPEAITRKIITVWLKAVIY